MNKGFFVVVSDDQETISHFQSQAYSQGVSLQVYSPSQWQAKLSDASFIEHLRQMLPTLSQGGGLSSSPQAKVLPFPSSSAPAQWKPAPAPQPAGSIQTMNEVESMAIKKAIFECRGNLTEAAKALGIGRATLYRKVKQYNIDPSLARLRRKAS